MDKKLIVLGSINADHIINVNQFPLPGETLTGNQYNIAFGGKGANQAVAAGRCGANIQFIAAVGDDDIGQKICQQLRTDKIDVHSVETICGEKTGVALISVNAQGENQIVIYAGANAAVTPEFVRRYENDIVTADAILMQLETPIASIEYAARVAKANGTQVIVNPAPAQALSDELLSLIDVITPNETEAEKLTGITISSEDHADRAAQILHDKGIDTVIITLGSKGAWVSHKREGKLVPGFVAKAIDTIGAGDTFNGVFIATLLEGKNLAEAIQHAHAAAAIAVTRQGAQPSVPWRHEIDNFLLENQRK